MAEGKSTDENLGSQEAEADVAEEDGNISSPERTLELASEELWTAAAMEEAEPCDIIEISDDILAELEAAEAEDPEPEGGAEGLVAAGLPEDTDLGEGEADEIELAAGYGYPPPFSRHNVVAPYTYWPYRVVGKLFFKRGSRSFVCSASSIGGCAIWTAGHCVHAGDGKASGWSTNVVFVPAYRNGSAPYGQWPAKSLWCRTSWYKRGIPKGLCQDMGGAVLFPKKKKKISQVVGHLGFAWNWSRVQAWHSIGYPAAPPFNGGLMVETEASYAYNGSVGCKPRPVGIGCDMTGGCSGGPWIWRFGQGNFLNGCNSYRRSSKPKEIYSPYFGKHAKSLSDLLRKATC